MAHLDPTKLISKIQLPGSTDVYEIHDSAAIHDISELNLSQALVFKGKKATKTELPQTGNKIGDVWYVADEDLEYVWIDSNNDGEGDTWEEFGNVHDAASSTHTHTFSGSGTVTNTAVSGTVTVPTVSATKGAVGGTAAAPALTPTTESVLGADATFKTTVTGSGVGTVSSTKLGASGQITANLSSDTGNALTGLGTPDKASAIATLSTTTIQNPTVTAVSIPNVTGNQAVTASRITKNDAISIPNVTGNEAVTASHITANDDVSINSVTSVGAGRAASWSANVENGLLTFAWTTNTPTTVAYEAKAASKIAASDVDASKVTLGTALSASKIAASDVDASKVTLGDELAASAVTTSNVTVATGANTHISAITDITPSSSAFVTGVACAPSIAITLNTNAAQGVDVVTGVGKTDITAATVTNDKDAINALTGVTAAASAVTLDSQVVTGVEIGSASSALTNGKLDNNAVAVSGTISAPNND